MLRMRPFEVVRPTTVEAAVAALAEHGPNALLIAGGTDLLPNLKHELHTPTHLVALAEIAELQGLRQRADGGLSIGAMTTLDAIAAAPLVRAQAAVLAQAAGLVAGPQLRRMGTLGGNVMLDTRCQWYNQTYFWRSALGFCMKKDGSVCHVVQGGSKCVAAASNDSAPSLMVLGAEIEFAGPAGRRRVLLEDLWRADGIHNKKIEPGEILVAVHLPPAPAGRRSAYGKLRDRGSIDYPLLGVAIRLDLGSDGRISAADGAVVALAARPLKLKGLNELLRGLAPSGAEFDAAVEAAGQAAHKQCHPLPNIPGDHDYRRRMVPVYVKRTLHAAARGAGPVHHV
jgi:4-hydroxybenzoyl-CoA reductase subunit beta